MSCTTCSTNDNPTASVTLDPVNRGDDKYINLVFTDANGDPYDLTGSTLVLTVKEKRSDTTTLVEDIQTDIDMIDPVNGQTQFHIDGDTTADWNAPRAVWYSVVWQLPDTSTITFMQGTFDVLEPVQTVNAP